MPRRSHKKSREGCPECKRRHLKCDETRPKCINCVTARLTCPYESEQRLVSDYSPSSASDPAHSGSTPSTSTPSRSPASISTLPPLSQLASDSSLNMLHLELLYRWSTGLYRSFLPGEIKSKNGMQVYADVCIEYGLRFPFLMRQILATAALNTALERPEQRSFYHQHATQLQSEALAGFNSIVGSLDESNIVPAFLVSSLVGLHTFCETFSYREGNFDATLDALIGCINLLRGVSSIIGSWWDFLLSSELRPILVAAHDKRESIINQPHELEDLTHLIQNADIGASSREAYMGAADELGKMFAIQADIQEPEGRPSANMIFAWLVTVPKEYVDLLSARRPEALVILAYYATVLHCRRAFWAIGDAGQFLIEGIGSHLGKHWDQWLAWPRSVLTT